MKRKTKTAQQRRPAAVDPPETIKTLLRQVRDELREYNENQRMERVASVWRTILAGIAARKIEDDRPGAAARVSEQKEKWRKAPPRRRGSKKARPRHGSNILSMAERLKK